MATRKLATAEDILSKTARTEDVEIPEWNLVVRIRELTPFEAKKIRKITDNEHGAVKITAMSAIDENGNRLFDDEQAKELYDKVGMAGFIRIQKAALRLNGFSETADSLDVVKND